MTFSFDFVDKQQLGPILPRLFHILHGNMSAIAPTGDSYEQDLALWRQNIVPAMQEDARQIVLMHCGGDLAGYFQYSAGDGLMMMEEIQIKKEYQGTGLFRELYLWLENRLPAGLVSVEAYSNKNNLKSQGILEYLGLERIGENASGSSYHYRGACRDLWERFR